MKRDGFIYIERKFVLFMNLYIIIKCTIKITSYSK